MIDTALREVVTSLYDVAQIVHFDRVNARVTENKTSRTWDISKRELSLSALES